MNGNSNHVLKLNMENGKLRTNSANNNATLATTGISTKTPLLLNSQMMNLSSSSSSSSSCLDFRNPSPSKYSRTFRRYQYSVL